MGIVDRASDTARIISNDEVCWRRPRTGTILAGGLALASVAAGAAVAADLAGGHGTTTLTTTGACIGAAAVSAGSLTIDSSLGAAVGRASLLTNGGTSSTANLTKNVGVIISNGTTSDGTLTNSGTVIVTKDVGGTIISGTTSDGTLNNSGTITNDGTHIGAVNNTGAAAIIVNCATGTWNGNLLSNSGGATVNNFGTWNGDANNASIVVNSGIWNTTSTGFTNSGTLTTTGTLNATAGGVTNTGTVNAQGLISGNIANIGPGTFTVTGPLSAGGGSFSNGSGAVLNVGANTFNNISTLTNSAGGTIDIAGGTIGAITTVNAGTINVTGLSTINGALTNSGVINLQNNVAGDRLTVTGNFAGSPGSRIALDASDQIVIGGSATGSTTLTVAGLGPGNPFTLGPNLVVINGATSPNAFTLGNVLNSGTLSVVLVSQANGTGLTFAPATIASVAGLSGTVAKIAAPTASFVSNEVAFDRMSDLRNSIRGNPSQGTRVAATAYAQEVAKDDPISPYVRAEAAAPPASVGSPKPAVWIRGFGDYEQRDGQASFSFAGTNFTSNLGYRQGTGGVMGGIDAVWSGLTTATDGLVLGLLGGYTYSKVELRDSPTTQVFSGPSVGAYGTYLMGSWFFDLLFKVDLLSLDIGIPGISQSANPTNYNLAANIGYRFDLPNHYYIEPTGGLEYVRTNFDHATALTATTVALNDGYALRARAGARVGTEWVTASVRVEPSLLGLAYEIAEATNSALLINGTSISNPSDVGRVRGELQGLVNVIDLQTGLSGFARVDTRFGEGLWSVGVKAGMRYQW
jgi:outer membrane autotransporter protein